MEKNSKLPTKKIAEKKCCYKAGKVKIISQNRTTIFFFNSMRQLKF